MDRTGNFIVKTADQHPLCREQNSVRVPMILDVLRYLQGTMSGFEMKRFIQLFVFPLHRSNEQFIRADAPDRSSECYVNSNFNRSFFFWHPVRLYMHAYAYGIAFCPYAI